MAHSLTDSLTDSFAFASVFVFVSIHSLSSLSDHIILTCFVCLSCQIACCLRLLTMRGPHPRIPFLPLPLLLFKLSSLLFQAPHSPVYNPKLHTPLVACIQLSFYVGRLHFSHTSLPLSLCCPSGWSGPTRACLFVSRQALGLMPP